MIYTSFFDNVLNIQRDNPEMIFYSIAGYSPRFYNESKDENYRKYPKLAPKYNWWKEWYNKFEKDSETNESQCWYYKKYIESVLSKLNAKEVADELYIHSSKHDHDICLLCYEKPDKFCHRKLVSEWFNKNGIISREYPYNINVKSV